MTFTLSFPLGFWDISLLTAITAIILLITSGMLSTPSSKVNIKINKKRLKNASLALSTIFLLTVAIRILNVILTS